MLRSSPGAKVARCLEGGIGYQVREGGQKKWQESCPIKELRNAVRTELGV